MLRYLLIVSCFAFLAHGAPTQVTILTDKNHYPYSYSDGDQVLGIYPQIVQEIDALMPDFTIQLVGQDWQEAKAAIRRGDSFALLSVYYHGHDWSYMYPYSQPIAEETVVTVCSDQALAVARPSWPSDYKGLLVANISGYDGWLNDQVRSKTNTDTVNFLEVPTTAIALDMVLKDRLDCALFEETALRYSLRRLEQSGEYQQGKYAAPAIGAKINTETVHLGYSVPAISKGKHPYAGAFQRQFDNALYHLKKSGKLKHIASTFTPPATPKE